MRGFDYSQEGIYFVTICTYQKEWLFGEIVNGKMILNEFGKIIGSIWQTLLTHHQVKLDAFQIMPNHVHLIIILPPLRRGIARNAPTFGNVTAGSLSCVIRSYKSECTKQIHQIIDNSELPIWQRNYYEHIIRNERDYWAIKQYIADNDKNWEQDDLYQN